MTLVPVRSHLLRDQMRLDGPLVSGRFRHSSPTSCGSFWQATQTWGPNKRVRR